MQRKKKPQVVDGDPLIHLREAAQKSVEHFSVRPYRHFYIDVSGKDDSAIYLNQSLLLAACH